MRAYLIRRLLYVLPTLLGISLVTFLLLEMIPGGPEEGLFRLESPIVRDAGQMARFRAEHHLDDPVMIRYLHWVGSILRMDFGTSFRDHRPVLTLIRERLPHTLLLNCASLFLMFTLSLPVGLLSAARRGGWFDRLSGILLYTLYCLPNFAVALFLQLFLAIHWDLLPLQGMESLDSARLGALGQFGDRLRHLALPTVCLTYGGLAYLSRFSRAGILESIRQEYITVARAKGMSEAMVLLKHALRNSLIPLLTLVGMLIPALISGSVIIERIFSWPGIGRLFFTAIEGRDYPVIMGLSTLSALLTLGGLLAADLLYAWADPRIAYRRRRTG